MTAAEHVERQVAIAVVVAVEKAALLMTVQRVIGGVEIEDDLLGRAVMRLKKQVDQQAFDHRPIVADLVVAGRLGPAQLEPVQRRLARRRRAVLAPGLELAGEDRHHRVMAELIVIDQLLIAERQSEHPLADQRLDLVLNQPTGGEAIDETNRPIHRAKQQRAGVRSDASAIESRHHATSFNGFKSKQIRDTVCLHRGAPRTQLSF
jgi:hypothetical protein